MNRLLFACVFGAVLLVPASRAAAQQTSRCADCHFAQYNVPAEDHLFDWDRSPHGRNRVGCEKCHGGDATTFESALAHRGIRGPGDPASPVNRANLPATCGACHVGPFVAFQDSRHYELLKSGNVQGPTCSTCHDSVRGQLLSAAALEKQCGRCHGPGEVAPRAERARNARQMYESLNAVREQMKLADTLIRRVSDRERRAALTNAYEQASVPLTRAINAGHRFVYADLQEQLQLAQQRVDALMSRIINQSN
jgi:hypothetical protein